jgi:hypothetical protein
MKVNLEVPGWLWGVIITIYALDCLTALVDLFINHGHRCP